MVQFLTGQKLNDAVYDVVNTAKTELVLMCPFFKLDGIVKNLLSEKLHDKGLEIVIVFGKKRTRFDTFSTCIGLRVFQSFFEYTYNISTGSACQILCE